MPRLHPRPRRGPVSRREPPNPRSAFSRGAAAWLSLRTQARQQPPPPRDCEAPPPACVRAHPLRSSRSSQICWKSPEEAADGYPMSSSSVMEVPPVFFFAESGSPTGGPHVPPHRPPIYPGPRS
ncbi:hypothetical protein Celaphus_00001084 [Cervus elaphus hippelaphus]|uniref:Uncharacterized protein n=1 Tax=Cervus elaphus hippelaphus TaxID=46360 RepID=A0A212D8X0_CEREH|nr:hypothetical protein Celaphus_00001084 [Cervus elaphus hippelaphus]